MLSCWHEVSHTRPTFRELQNSIAQLDKENQVPTKARMSFLFFLLRALAVMPQLGNFCSSITLGLNDAVLTITLLHCSVGKLAN